MKLGPVSALPAPSTSFDGIDLEALTVGQVIGPGETQRALPKTVLLYLQTDGASTIAAPATLRAFRDGRWYPAGPAKGLLNGGLDIAIAPQDGHCERVSMGASWERLAVVGGLTGDPVTIELEAEVRT